MGRPLVGPWVLGLSLLVGMAGGLSGCRVNVPALDCVRDDQCASGQHCAGGRCLPGAGADADGGGQDAASDLGEDLPEDTSADPSDALDGADAVEDASDAPGDLEPDPPVDAEDGPGGELGDGPVDVVADLPSLDPAPDDTDPGEYRCATGPDSDVDAFNFVRLEPTDAFTLSGVVTGASGAGTWYVQQAGGRQSLGTLATNDDGSFRAVVPAECGSSLVKLVWPGTDCDLVLVLGVQTDQCRTEDIHVGLWWNLEGDDLELHLVRQGGRINDPVDDCDSESCIGVHPDWGPEGPDGDPRKDFDATSGGGPENIVVATGASGTYTIVVERWGEDDATPSDAVIIASLSGQPYITQTLNLPPRNVWVAATLDADAGRWTPINHMIDCSAEDWTAVGGCPLDLP